MNTRKKYGGYVYGKPGVERAMELYYSLRLISILILDDTYGSGGYKVTLETDCEEAEPYILRGGFEEVRSDYQVA